MYNVSMNEIYLYKKNTTNPNAINVAMAYPSTYYYGMSVLGYLSMFKEFDLNENVNAQRIFLNSKSLGFDTKYLDLLGFSCVFDLDILQILKILKKYNFNIYSAKRKKKMPLIFAGGPVITSNPEPFADFFDFMMIGDGEGLANEVAEVYAKNKNKTKIEILKELSKIEGIYVPSLYKVEYENNKISRFYPSYDDVKRTIQKRTIHSTECLFSPIISENTFYSNTVFIEISRGCPFECKFCTAHWQNEPFRAFDLKYIKAAIKKASKYASKIVFIGAMISAHPDFEELCNYIKKLQERKNFKVEFSSLSSEYLSKNVVNILEEKNISLSIEAGSESLRYKIGKNLSDETLKNTIEFYIEQGIKKFNLYYMIGLPGETDLDIDEYIKASIKQANQYSNINFSHILSTFNPKPFTPYQLEKRQSPFVLEERLGKIEEAFRRIRNLDIIPPIIKKDAINSFISLGDRRVGSFIARVSEKNIPLKNIFIEYKKFMKMYNTNSSSEYELPHYSNYIYRTKTNDELLPWGFINF